MSEPAVAGDETPGKVLSERELDDGWVERDYGDDAKVETRTPGLAIALVENVVRRVRAWRQS
jgi:hypothetical protein